VVLAGEAVGTPKAATGLIEAIRLLRVARRSAMKARTQAANQIHSVIDTASEQVRAGLLCLSERERIAKAARLRLVDVSRPVDAAKLALATLARRWQALTAEIAMLDDQLDGLVHAAAPSLMAIKGVGTETAGILLAAAGDNPGWLRSEASYAAVCGSSPVDASSGRRLRHRLNPGGDRQANSAPYLIALNRLSWDQRSKDYMATRIGEGKTKRKVIRCLKRYVAREVYKAIIRDLASDTRTKRVAEVNTEHAHLTAIGASAIACNPLEV
jgi:transposase